MIIPRLPSPSGKLRAQDSLPVRAWECFPCPTARKGPKHRTPWSDPRQPPETAPQSHIPAPDRQTTSSPPVTLTLAEDQAPADIFVCLHPAHSDAFLANSESTHTLPAAAGAFTASSQPSGYSSSCDIISSWAKGQGKSRWYENRWPAEECAMCGGKEGPRLRLWD